MVYGRGQRPQAHLGIAWLRRSSSTLVNPRACMSLFDSFYLLDVMICSCYDGHLLQQAKAL